MILARRESRVAGLASGHFARALYLTVMTCAAVISATGTAEAQRRTAATSAYTDLDLRRCTLLRSNPDEGASSAWRCPGQRGIPLLVAERDSRFDIDAGARTADFETAGWFSSLPRRSSGDCVAGSPSRSSTASH